MSSELAGGGAAGPPRFPRPPAWTRLLPLGGWLAGWEPWLDPDERARLFAALLREVSWAERTIVIAGREVREPRLSAWHGDPGAVYTYSGRRNEPLAWTPALAELRAALRATTGHDLDAVLCNRYRDGRDAMGMHADREPELGPEPLIASVSLGATRRFVLQPRERARRTAAETLTVPLADGTLLVMGGATQQRYRHGVPREAGAVGERINLTFRRILRPPR